MDLILLVSFMVEYFPKRTKKPVIYGILIYWLGHLVDIAVNYGAKNYYFVHDILSEFLNFLMYKQKMT